MSRHERSGTRDLLFSGWHRTLPDYCAAIDLDFIEYCPSCYAILGLFELTFDRSKKKPTTILERLAHDAGTSAYVVYLTRSGDQLTGADLAQVYPHHADLRTMTEPELRVWFIGFHDHHNGDPCRGALAATEHRARRDAA